MNPKKKFKSKRIRTGRIKQLIGNVFVKNVKEHFIPNLKMLQKLNHVVVQGDIKT